VQKLSGQLLKPRGGGPRASPERGRSSEPGAGALTRDGGRTGPTVRGGKVGTQQQGGLTPSWRVRNPPATVADQRRARVVFDAFARRFADEGAVAVVLGGSWARGEAHRASDIDLWVLGHRYGRRTLLRDGFPVNIERTTERIERRRFRDPRRVGGCVPGWRSALVVHDPHGVAAKLVAEARAFRWSSIAAQCDRWVAEEITGWGEEAVKLVRALGEGQLETAAVQRNLLANRLAVVMAVHHRILWGSENGMWERVGARVGGPWQRAQRSALGASRGGFEASCRAALDLYGLTADAVRETLSDEQAGIVAHVRQVVGSPPRRPLNGRVAFGRSGPTPSSANRTRSPGRSAVLGQ